MKFFKYLFIWLGVFIVLAFVAGYVYVRVEGKNIFERQLTKFFGQPVTINEIRYLLPTGIRVTDMQVRNILEAEDVRFHLRIPYLLHGKFVVAKVELKDPVFHLVRHDKKKMDFGGVYLSDQEKRFNPEKQDTRPVDGILIDFLDIQNGAIEILDLAADEPVKYEISSINAKAMKVVYPMEDKDIKFDGQGVVTGAGPYDMFSDARFKINGWVNWVKRNMEASADFERDDGLSGKMTMAGKGNNLKTTGRLKLESFKDKSQSEDGHPRGLKDVISEALENANSTLTFNFSFETAMDELAPQMVDFNGVVDIPKKRDAGGAGGSSNLLNINPALPVRR